MTLRIDPDTLFIEGLPRYEGGGAAAMSAAEFAARAAVPPPCPVCGAPVLIDRIDVTLNEAAEVLHGRSYVAGRWECPHHCNPRTGQRMHYGQEFRTGASLAGTECACSCGDKTVALDEAERAVWPAVHKPPWRPGAGVR